MIRPRSALLMVLLASVTAAVPAAAASNDNTVEWNGVSHVTWLDRAPLCPVDGETFEVRFQTYADDLTAARVRVDDGTAAWIGCLEDGARGPYDVWTATRSPRRARRRLSYYIELTDGTDVDYLSVGGMSASTPVRRRVRPRLHDARARAGRRHSPAGRRSGVQGLVADQDRRPRPRRVQRLGHRRPDDEGRRVLRRSMFPNANVGQMYKYYFQNLHWNTDPRARALNPERQLQRLHRDPFGYDWQVDDFDVPDFEEMVIYQLHVGTFAGRNDPYGTAPFPAGYVDVAARAAHLAELGVNAVMLNPITEFPGDYSAGYNPITAWAPEWKYGTPDDLKDMVDTLHAHGIAVLLDIVWNHFSLQRQLPVELRRHADLLRRPGRRDPVGQPGRLRRATGCATTSSTARSTGSRSSGSTASGWTPPTT